MGIGLAVAQALASRDMEVVLVARGEEALRQAVASLAGAGHSYHAFDVSDEEAWGAVELDELYGLVCAAAVIKPVGPIGEYTPAEFRRTLEINVLGTLLAVHHCLPALRAGRGSIVAFSGGGATAPLPRYDAYASSKAAVVRLCENLSTALAPLAINCVAPGFVATRMHEATLTAGPDTVGRAYYEKTRSEIEKGGFPASEAAELVCLLLSGVPFSGKLISAQWDPWRDPAFQQRLVDEPDFATVRRIDGMLFQNVPKKRPSRGIGSKPR
jgi:NAD(P)-dependent dehydrogenase (short-subunit alcohol dehydrogenase family)